jgi:REP element-mobilizing transposase RayT
MNKYSLPLEEGKFYHIYNQGNNGENLYYNDSNYGYFLKKMDWYLSEYIEVYAFCLMPNHFHLLVRVRTLEELDEKIKKTIAAFKLVRSSRPNKFDKHEAYSDFISNQFRLFFMSYSKAINKQTERKGSLFRERFKRKEITSLTYLQNTVVYIHRNPLHHGFEEDFKDYRWSSYDRMLEDKVTKLKKQEVLEWFEDKENYRYVHCVDVEDDMEN